MPISTPECDKGTLGFRQMLSAEHAGDAFSAHRRVSRVAGMAASGDLGFVAGTEAGGSYVTVMKCEPACLWRVALDESVMHSDASMVAPELVVAKADWMGTAPPAGRLVAADAAGVAMSEFTEVLRQEGLAAGLRTYGRNNDFRLFLEGNPPFEGVDAANNHLVVHAIAGQFRERARDRSADGVFMYSVGEFEASHRQEAFECLQLWQYDAKVANWGMRVMLLSGASPRTKTSAAL